MKQCSTCKQHKPLGRYTVRTRAKDGLNESCKSCANERQTWRRALHPNEQRLVRLKSKYGISGTDFEKLTVAQGGVCAICDGPPVGNGNKTNEVISFQVDHNHDTDEVRSLLCSNCNTGIGLLAEDPDRLRRAADYLELPSIASGVLR